MRAFALIASALLLTAAAPAPRSLPGPDGGYDYASIDPAANRLYVARSTSVTVYDLRGTTPPRSIGSIAHGHAVLPFAGGRQLLVTSGADDSVRILDSADGGEKARIAVGHDPDGTAIRGSTAYVMNAKDGTVSVIDLKTAKLAGTATLKPGLEFPALAGGTLFVNNEDENEIETLDLATLKAGAPIPLPGCTGPSGLAYDEAGGRLISACDNGKAAIVSVRAHKLESLVDIGQGPDAVLLDAARHHALIPCGGSGELIEIGLQGTPRVVRHIATDKGARTGAVDARTGIAYLPAARFGPAPQGAKRGAPVPGSFRVLAVPVR